MQECAESEFEEHPPIRQKTQWWIVSALLHAFGIALATVMSFSIQIPDRDRPVILSSEFFPNSETRPEEISEVPIFDRPPVVKSEPLDVEVLVAAAAQQFEAANVEFEQVRVDGTTTDDAQNQVGDNGYYELNLQASGDSGAQLSDDLIGSGSATRGVQGQWGSSQREGGPIQRRTDGHGTNVDLGGREATHFICRYRNSHCHFESIVGNALKWLADHQEADGSWSAQKYGASAKTDTAVTGMAVLAFLGAGNTERFGYYQEPVRKAVSWLKSKQDAEGMIWDVSDDAAPHRAKGYPCAIASLALIEAGGMSNIAGTRAAAQKAIDYICNVHQASDGARKQGWRYAPGSGGDLSVTGWFMMALKSAKVCGYRVPHESVEGALDFLETLEVKEQGLANGESPSRFKYMPNDDHSQSAHRLTAIGVLMRQFMGWKTEDLSDSYKWFMAKGGVPAYGANGEKVDLYYWYYASLVSYQQSRVNPEMWNTWFEAMKSAIANHQCLAGDERGSWTPAGEYSGEWGRVGQTALSALILECQQRYSLTETK